MPRARWRRRSRPEAHDASVEEVAANDLPGATSAEQRDRVPALREPAGAEPAQRRERLVASIPGVVVAGGRASRSRWTEKECLSGKAFSLGPGDSERR